MQLGWLFVGTNFLCCIRTVGMLQFSKKQKQSDSKFEKIIKTYLRKKYI